ncbi:MAG: class I SAM-dependent methyltransferase [Opitutaceae bacterium]
MNSISRSSLSSASNPVFELSSFAFFGRTLAEYTRFFSLDPAALRGRAVLDVAAGPSSFAAEANRAGIAAVAVDPLYGCPSTTLAAHVQLDYARTLAQMRAKPELLTFKSFASVDEAEASRRSAAAFFLDDYEDGFLQGRYVGGALPRLPFEDGSFDLVLCAHLLFIYRRMLGYDFHLAACRELVRVSRGEVRIHPVCGPDGLPYAELPRLRVDLAKTGVDSRIVTVDYEFFRGSGTMLVLGGTEG